MLSFSHTIRLFFLSSACAFPVASYAQDENTDIEQIKALRGIVLRGNDKSGKPVLDIFFWCRSVTDANFPSLHRLPNILTINLVGNEITGKSLVTLRGMKHLQRVYASDTHVGDDGCEHLATLPNLEELHLADCPITDEGLRHLGKISSLKHLNLASTQITDKGFVHLGKLKNLHTLGLRDAKLDGKGIAQLRDLVNLKDLSLKSDKIGDSCVFDLVESFPNLESLRITSSDLTDESFRHLSKLKNLKSLFLGSNPKITGESSLRHLSKLRELDELDLGRTGLTSRCGMELKYLTNVKNLGLECTDVDDNIIQGLVELKDLRVLWLTCTKISPEGMRQLYARLPKTFIQKVE